MRRRIAGPCATSPPPRADVRFVLRNRKRRRLCAVYSFEHKEFAMPIDNGDLHFELVVASAFDVALF